MTLDEFLEALEKTPRNWELNGRLIRLGPPGMESCPICEVHNKGLTLRYVEAGDDLGLDRLLSHEIAMAADYSHGHSPDLRARLLKACGLPS